ncbi:MAG: hypothetical protein HC880_07270 [Bacteroidia bacterium]|nr:hypothetical protein [Bacteroidia bacterium]
MLTYQQNNRQILLNPADYPPCSQTGTWLIRVYLNPLRYISNPPLLPTHLALYREDQALRQKPVRVQDNYAIKAEWPKIKEAGNYSFRLFAQEEEIARYDFKLKK